MPTTLARAPRRDRMHGAHDRRRAAPVGLHLLHAVGGLDRDAAGVERHTLADQRHRRAGPAVPAHHRDEALLVAAAPDARPGAHAHRLDLTLPDQRDIEPETPERGDRAREFSRRQNVRRFIDEIAREEEKAVDRADPIAPGFTRQVRSRGDDGQVRQGCARLGFGRERMLAVAVEAIARHQRALHLSANDDVELVGNEQRREFARRGTRAGA